MKPVVRNIQNQDLYFYLGENKFQNIRTGTEGVVDDETARKVFKVNVEATTMLNEYPNLVEMIKTLNLKFDKQ
jgi:hypothetical protein